MPNTVAIVVTDLQQTRLGLPATAQHHLAGRPVLELTVRRMQRVRSVEAVVVLHPAGQDPMVLLADVGGGKPVSAHAWTGPLEDKFTAMRQAARKWALTAWRGGLGGATCYDELLPAAPLLAAMDSRQATSALLVGGNWPLVDPDLAELVLRRHLDEPDAMQMTFCQAPPGLCPIAIGRSLLEKMAGEPSSSFGHLLGYNPQTPQADPIGRDLCVQVSAAVRSSPYRFIFDTPRTIDQVRSLDMDYEHASAEQVVAAAAQLPRSPLPQQITVELTPRRMVRGPLTSQAYTTLDRPPMDVALLEQVLRQAAAAGDLVVTFGGLGDALLHPQWREAVRLARGLEVLGIAVETDLLLPQDEVMALLDVPIDVLTVRLSADTAAVYEAVMQPEIEDGFRQVTSNLQALITERNERWQRPSAAANHRPGIPWIVPRLIKTRQTLKDMETFYDRWVHFSAHAVIEPMLTGAGIAPDLNPMPMAPPQRSACPQLARRLTVLSNGVVALCDQDWQGSQPLAQIGRASLADAWCHAAALHEQHRQQRWDASPLCARCTQWHRV